MHVDTMNEIGRADTRHIVATDKSEFFRLFAKDQMYRSARTLSTV